MVECQSCLLQIRRRAHEIEMMFSSKPTSEKPASSSQPISSQRTNRYAHAPFAGAPNRLSACPRYPAEAILLVHVGQHAVLLMAGRGDILEAINVNPAQAGKHARQETTLVVEWQRANEADWWTVIHTTDGSATLATRLLGPLRPLPR